MAYEKQEWVDDDTTKGKVTATRMTHIENGIYDNSLATDKINPSGTATTTAEIEEGQINDVIGFKSLKLKGQTSQYTTQGYNLLDIYARHPAGYTETVSGVTFTYNNDGSINANGKATADINYFLASQGQLGDDIFNGTNYLSGCTGGSLTTFFLQFWADTIGAYQQATTEVATNKTSGVNWNITIAIKNGVTINKTFYPMMSATSGKTFEKYSGGKASPNPDYPQEVNNVSGYNVVKIKNKNLWQNANNQVVSAYGITLTTNDDNSVTMTGSATNSSIYFTNVKKIMAEDIRDGNYTLSFGNGSNTSFIAYRLRKYDGTTKTEIKAPTTLAVANYTYTFNLKNLIDDNTIQVELDLVRYGTGANDRTLYPQIEAGSTASSYAKYQSNEYEINLGNNLMKTKPLVEATVNGITFTPVYDGNKLQYVNVNGTSTAVATYTLQNANVDAASTYVDELIAGTYTLSDFSGSNTPNIAIFLRYTTNGSTFTTQNSVDNKTFTVSSKFKYASYIRIASGTTINNMKFYPQIEKGAIATSYAPYFPPIELCKIGTYQDYIYKKDGKWWKHKEVEKITLNGSETPTINTALTNTTRALYSNILPYKSKAGAGSGICNLLPYYENWVTDVEGFYLDNNTTNLVFRINKSTVGTTITSVNNFLSENNMTVYYIVETAIEEEITYTPLIRQLDELYNSGLYDVTNISQDNSSEAFILDMEACKNNINGIVEYIRR